MIRSMTGYGSASGTVAAGTVNVEVRSVNHRFFNPTIKLSGALVRWEGDVREAMKRKIARGHVTLFARYETVSSETEPVLAIDEVKFAAYVAQLRSLEERFGLAPGIDVSSILRLPDVMVGNVSREDLPDDAGAALVAVVEQAVDGLLAMRVDEGAKLRTFLEERLSLIEAALARVAIRAPERLVEQRDRLRASVKELAAGVVVDENRIAQEIAFLADRLDVQEELSRFDAHISAFRAALGGNQPDGVGKRLGFLLQEMLREANTTGSKGTDSQVITDVLLIKEELERIREQVENLE